MDFFIRSAQTKDIATIMKMRYDLFKKWDSMDRIDRIEHAWFNTRAHRSTLNKILKARDKKLFVAETKCSVIGYLKAEILEREKFLKKVGYISEIYINPAHRGAGIGLQLLSEALTWFREKGLLWSTASTHSSDDVAIPFWEKQGYTEFNKFFKRRI